MFVSVRNYTYVSLGVFVRATLAVHLLAFLYRRPRRRQGRPSSKHEDVSAKARRRKGYGKSMIKATLSFFGLSWLSILSLFLGPSWGSWSRLGPYLKPSWGSLGASWRSLGPSWAALGVFWSVLGGPVERPRVVANCPASRNLLQAKSKSRLSRQEVLIRG